uniref:ALMS motif domain-containing protein n=1 Tax=Setaria digitata TaxID=48799 RepID=A0A915PMD4_9BILA
MSTASYRIDKHSVAAIQPEIPLLTEETNLVTRLMADNRQLRELYLAEQRKALTERKRRIAAEARLAAFLGKKVAEMREKERSHRSNLDYDLSTVDRTNTDLLENYGDPPFIDSSHEDRIALLVMNNIKKYQNRISAVESVTRSTTSSSVKSNEHPSDSLNNKRNNTKSLSVTRLAENNLEKPESTQLSRFWLFIDKNGQTKSPVLPPLNHVQQKRKEAFIRRSNERQIRIQEASARRRELAAAKRKVAKQLLAGQAVNRDALRVLSLMDRQIYAFSPQTMKHETIRRIYKTKEFQERKKRRREEYDTHVNRLLAYSYSQVPYRFRRKC